MIKPNELRIGNLIEYLVEDDFHGNEWMFNKVDSEDILMCVKDNDYFNRFYRPIPITPEILGKCPQVTDFNEIVLKDSYGNNVYAQYDFGDMDFRIGKSWYRCEYLHHLQNIFFDLSGEELKYNP